MTARDEILAALPAVRARTGSETFTAQDVVDELGRRGSRYKASTIRTHVVSRMCADAPDHHASVFDDLERVDPGRYRARDAAHAAAEVPVRAGATTEHGVKAVEWLCLAQACAANGLDLLEDAQLLLEHGRHPRALSLAILALEEFGKAGRALEVITSGGADDVVTDFEHDFSRHGPKIAAGLTLNAIFEHPENFEPDVLENLACLVKDSSARKMRGFYVDGGTAGLERPADVDRSEAEMAIAVARVVAGPFAPKIALVTDEGALELWTFGPQLRARMLSEVETHDATDAQTLIAIRDTLRRIEAGEFQDSGSLLG